MEYYSKMKAALERIKEEALEVAIGYKVEWERELLRRKRLGISGEEPVPHADQIHIDLDTGEITIFGPMTRQEKAALEADAEARIRVLRDPVLAHISELEKQLENETDPDARMEILDWIDDRKRVLEMLVEAQKDLLRYLTTGQRPPERDGE